MDKKPEMSKERRAARDAILAAFRDAVLDGGYDGLRVVDLVERSGVARSTFYEHFRSREDVLRDSMRDVMRPLAQLASPSPDLEKTVFILEHFEQNAELAKSIIDRGDAPFVQDLLAELVAHSSPILREVAQAIAGAQLALICLWLNGKDTRPASALAQLLRDVTVAVGSVVTRSSRARQHY